MTFRIMTNGPVVNPAGVAVTTLEPTNGSVERPEGKPNVTGLYHTIRGWWAEPSPRSRFPWKNIVSGTSVITLVLDTKTSSSEQTNLTWPGNCGIQRGFQFLTKDLATLLPATGEIS